MTLVYHKIENHSMNAEDSKALRIDKFRKWKHSLHIEHGIYTQADTLVCVVIKIYHLHLSIQ